MDIIINSVSATPVNCEAPLDFGNVILIVVIACVLGILWAAYNFFLVRKIDVEKGIDG